MPILTSTRLHPFVADNSYDSRLVDPSAAAVVTVLTRLCNYCLCLGVRAGNRR